jgi:predicted nucleic acid-binding Zn ribbon protein
MEITYSCLVCGNEFNPIRVAQKYCSKRCKDRADKNDRHFGGVREYVVGRDNHKCQKCGSELQLVVHHRDWDRTHNDPSNLITLCRSCHKKEHFDVIDVNITKTCAICGIEFNPMRTKRKSQILCKRKVCFAKWKAIQKRSTHEQVDCIICGQPFTQKHSHQVCCSNECTEINNDRHKEIWYSNNREEVIERQKGHYEANKEAKLKYIKHWQIENAEKVKEYKLVSAVKNRDRRNARSRELYRLRHALPSSLSV